MVSKHNFHAMDYWKPTLRGILGVERLYFRHGASLSLVLGDV